ncbi:MAG: hypothetical protein R2800_05795 [Flavipsychrobacter sp.]
MKKLAIALLAITTLSLSSCSKVLLGIYGIKSAKPMSNKEVGRVAQKNGYSLYSIYTLDSSYNQLVHSDIDFQGVNDSDKIYKVLNFKKQLSQPLQYMLFDASGKLIVHSVNCHTGGFPNLKWDREQAFQQFPPVPLSSVDSTFTMDDLKKYLHVVNVNGGSQSYDYQCVVFWNRFMGRQSKRLVKLALSNLKQAELKGKKVRVHLVNNEHYFYQLGFDL